MKIHSKCLQWAVGVNRSTIGSYKELGSMEKAGIKFLSTLAQEKVIKPVLMPKSFSKNFKRKFKITLKTKCIYNF